MRRDVLVTIPDLNKLMVMKNATNERLAEAAGVGVTTIVRARNLRSIRPLIASCIMEALETRKFTRSVRGARKCQA